MKIDTARYDVWVPDGDEFVQVHSWKELPAELTNVVVTPTGVPPANDGGSTGFVVPAQRSTGAGRRGRTQDATAALEGLVPEQRWAALGAWSDSTVSVSLSHDQQHEALRAAARSALSVGRVAGHSDADTALALIRSGTVEASMMPQVLADSVEEPDVLYSSNRRAALAMRLSADGTLHTSLAKYPCPEVIRACPVTLLPDALAQPDLDSVYFLVQHRDDTACVALIAEHADRDELHGALKGLSYGMPPPAVRQLLTHPDLAPDETWTPHMLAFATTNPNITPELAAAGLAGMMSPPHPGAVFAGMNPTNTSRYPVKDLRAEARAVATALSANILDDNDVAAALSGIVHESVLARVVGNRRSGTALTEVAVNSSRPTVRRAAAAAALRDGDVATQLRLTQDHDVATRCRLAAHSQDPSVLTALSASPERVVREQLEARGVTCAPLPELPREYTGEWEKTAPATDRLWLRLDRTPAYGEAVDDTWTGRSVASRLEAEASDLARSQAYHLTTLNDRLYQLGDVPDEARGARHEQLAAELDADPLWPLNGLNEFANVPDEHLANAGTAISILWKQTANTNGDNVSQRWLASRAASVHNLDVEYQRAVNPSNGSRGDTGWDEQHQKFDELAGEVTDLFLRAAHEEAVDRCRALGVAHVPVSRGMSMSRAEAKAAGITVFEAEDVADGTAQFLPYEHTPPQAPLASWSSDHGGASWGNSPDTDRVQVVMRTMLPVEDIAGFGGAGFCGIILPDGIEGTPEGEVLVLGRDRPCEILAMPCGTNSAREYAEGLMKPPPWQ